MSITQEKFQKPFWSRHTDTVRMLLETGERGLSSEEAEARLRHFGENTIAVRNRVSRLKIFLSQLKSPLIFILVIAGGVTAFFGHSTDSIFIFAAVIINASLGFYQENKAETALTALKSYIKERARIVRDGNEMEIDAAGIVPGDFLRLTPGIRVPADGRVIYESDLSLDEAILTGESLPVSKKTEPVDEDAPIAEQSSMVFAGTFVDGGIGAAFVTATGKNTEIGRIASLIKEGREKTPLQKSISRLALQISVVLGFFIAGLFTIGIVSRADPFEMFLTSIAVAVSAIPEGLPIALTVTLAIGVERLVRKKGVVRKLLAAETLGGATVILTDKTGTLTQSQMELTDISSEEPKEDVLEIALLNSDAVPENPEDPPEKWRIIGKPLESAVVRAAGAHRVFLQDLKKKATVIAYRPFNSRDKFSAAYLDFSGKKFWSYLGAPEILLEKTGSGNKDKICAEIETRAREGYRVLGVATEEKFLGLLLFRDPVRPNVKNAIKEVAEAGVKTVIVTGDHEGTALAVAREVGVFSPEDEEEHALLKGSDIVNMKDETLLRRLDAVKVFARVSPEDKLRIVRLYKEKGETVAMTGDGVNDAPALKEANIGIAVGAGTDVAKGAADLVILDNNFETIVFAIEEGRRILANVKKIIVYVLSSALDELILIGGSILTGLPSPLNARQILWVNFFSDSFPAIAFAFESADGNLRRKIFGAKRELIDKEMRFFILFVGVATSAFLFVLYYFLLKIGYDPILVKTFIFVSFAAYSLFITFSFRNLHASIFKYNPFSNPYLLGGVAIGLVLTAAAAYLPELNNLLGTVALPVRWLVNVGIVFLANITVVEIGKSLFISKKE